LVLVKAALSNLNSQDVVKVLVSLFQPQAVKISIKFAPSNLIYSLVWHAASIKHLLLALEDFKLFHQLIIYLRQPVSQDALTVASSI
jgi:hypothetical protein